MTPDDRIAMVLSEAIHRLKTKAPLAHWISTPGRNPGTIRRVKQSIVALDMEGVLTPEIWIAVARATGIEKLRLTTRDVPDYDVLMRGRLALLAEHGLALSEIQSVIGRLHPLPGAIEFLRELRCLTQVIILSDTFEQFAQPLLRQLEWPTLFCHRLRVENDRVLDYQLRIPDQKRATVNALRALNYRVVAAGDSYNDLAMLDAADLGILFRPPPKLRIEHPGFPAVENHADLLRLIRAAYAEE